IQLYRWFPSILQVLTIVRPETIVRWHRAGFRRYWSWKSRPRGGRPQIEADLRALIRRNAPHAVCLGSSWRKRVSRQSSSTTRSEIRRRWRPPRNPGRGSQAPELGLGTQRGECDQAKQHGHERQMLTSRRGVEFMVPVFSPESLFEGTAC
ncbi:MAG: hypothetical protein QOF09_4634, partial [Alphaproteobacteria bacterium]|nr:hypothetical protein [Alphaproteobacteria bacterium]